MTMLDERTGGGRHGVRRTWRERLRRSVRRSLKGRNAKWALAALAAVAVLIIGLLFQGYLGSPARTISSDPTNSSAGGFDPSPQVTAKPKLLKAGPGKGTGAVSGGLYGQLKAAFPDNPLNHLRGPGLHQVSVEVSSSQPIKIVGYLVPTGLSSPYATVHPNTRSFAVSQQALGGGYLAAVFVQSDERGAPITCRVVVDGKVTNAETAHGSYGRAVCLG